MSNANQIAIEIVKVVTFVGIISWMSRSSLPTGKRLLVAAALFLAGGAVLLALRQDPMGFER